MTQLNEVISIEEPTTKPNPIISLLKSRKTIVSIVGLVLNFVIAAVPDIAPLREELMTIVTGITLALVGTIAWEDTAKEGRLAAEETKNVPNDVLIKGLFGDLVDTVINLPNGQTVITLKPNASTPASETLFEG